MLFSILTGWGRDRSEVAAVRAELAPSVKSV